MLWEHASAFWTRAGVLRIKVHGLMLLTQLRYWAVRLLMYCVPMSSVGQEPTQAKQARPHQHSQCEGFLCQSRLPGQVCEMCEMKHREDLNCVSLPSQMQLNPKRYRNMKTLECKNLKLLKYKVQNGRTFRMSLRLLFSASQSLNNNYQLHLASLLSWHWRKLSFSGMLTFKRKKRPLAKNSIPLGILIY